MDKRILLFAICCTLTFLGFNLWFPQEPSSKEQPLPRQETNRKEMVAVKEETFLSPSLEKESFYVLENEYQQLVFSSAGGSLAEINLPLHSKENSVSLVKEIDIDREILENSPPNARFPLFPFQTADGTVHEKGSLGGYYPLLRRPIFSPEGIQKTRVAPQYYAMNVVGEDPKTAQISYRVTRFEKNLIQWKGSDGMRTITKTFSIPEEQNGPYCFDLTIEIDGDRSNLWLSSGVPDVEIVANSYAPLLRSQLPVKGGFDVDTIDLPKKGPLQNNAVFPNWISNSNGFFGVILDPLEPISAGYQARMILGNDLPTRLTIVDPGYHPYPAADYPGYATYLPLDKEGPLSFRIFAGPYDGTLLQKLDALYSDGSYSPDYIAAQSIQGWFSFISEPFTKLLRFLINLFFMITHSWAASILLLTIALRIMMYPLNSWQIRSQKKMQEMAPLTKAIDEKYKKDPQKAQMEKLKFYKEHGYNPFSGCLPMLVQIPFLTGMFYLLKSFFPLRGAIFIPGWINNLAAPDILFSWGQPLWFIGNEFHLLPVLMGVSMYLQSRFNSSQPKPAALSDAEKQQKMMMLLLPFMMVFLFYSLPSGLNIYFMGSTLLTMLQQWWMTRKTI